jgi:hypothetical protein
MKRILLLAGAGVSMVLAARAGEYSALWGRTGEAWNPAGRLPDVSFAGYACGSRVLPKVPLAANVRDFGAKGDGVADDSAAFLAAIAKVERGAIEIPAGRYRITQILEITKPGVVLRGAGPERTMLVCPVPLNDIKPDWGKTTGGLRTSNYSWSGGIVSFHGRNSGKSIGPVMAAPARGGHDLVVGNRTSGLRPGAWIEITVKDDAEKSLIHHLYSGDPGDVSKIKESSHTTSFVSRITAVAEGKLTLERPLRIDLRPEWKPQVRFYQPSVTESGIEDLAFEFPVREYGGHFSELGFNAVDFSGVADCWARNLIITNADSGIFAGGRFCTIDGVRYQLRGAKESDGVFGHHGFTLSGHDNLLTRFEVRQRFIHDISMERGAGNVASSGSGTDLCFDHHRRAPYDNVFTDIDLGSGARMWKHGGGNALGWPCGAHGTFWNIRSKQAQVYPLKIGSASINLVAVQSHASSEISATGRWFEAISPDRLDPPNLHEAQWIRRLGVR